jgi:SAM-dependent methyltransferase
VWTTAGFLRGVQYAGPSNLAARQAIYAYQQPKVRMFPWALAFAALEGAETVVDVGCGNGSYLAELRRSGHPGLTVGLDLSMGMVASVAGSLPGQAVAQGDASKLPLRTASAHVCLAMHMLYHVPDRRAAVAELRRVVRQDGCVLMVLNRAGHTAELRAIIERAQSEAGYEPGFPFIGSVLLPEGAELLAEAFGSVDSYELDTKLVVTDPEAVVAYAGSVNLAEVRGVDEERVLGILRRLVADEIAHHGAFNVTTSSGCLVARP